MDSYLSLPSRVKPKLTVLTNVYEVRAERLPNRYYLYTTPDKLTSADRSFIAKLGKQGAEQICQSIGFICFYKKGLLGSVSVNQPLRLQISELGAEKGTKTLTFTKNGAIDLAELISCEAGLKFMRTSLSGALRRIMQKRQSKVILHKYKHFVFQASSSITLDFLHFGKKIWLTTDATHKLQEQRTLLEYMAKYSIDEVSSLLAGAKVVKNYGNLQELFVVGIERNKKPTDVMDKVTFEQYYLTKYNIQIKDLSQPLVIASRRKTGQPQQNAQNVQNVQYLVPELVSLADKSFTLDFPSEILGELEKMKQILPQEKESTISEIINELGAEDIIKKAAINLDAYQLTVPTILLKNAEIQPQEAVFEFRHPILHSPELRSWAVAYSCGTSANEKQEADNLINYFRTLTRIYGLNITSSPSSVGIEGSGWSSWKSGLEQNFKKYGNLQIILLFLKEQQQKHYYPLKQLLTSRMKCPSQIIRKRTLGTACRKPYSIATDALIQIITKIGGTPWDLKRESSALSDSWVMQGALTIGKSQLGYHYHLVGSTGKEQDGMFSYFKKNLTKQQFKADLENSLMVWAKSFVVNCRNPPQNILLYRKCEGQPQTREETAFQLSIFMSLGSKIGLKTKQQNYSPYMAFINVVLQQKMQLYTKQLLKSDFVLKNVRTGTVVYEQSSTPKAYNFYLCSKIPLTTTAKPVKYEVICNNESIKKEDLAQFSYESCYCYFNFQGAHAVPAVLQYSMKLGRLAAKFGSVSESEDKLKGKLYYL